MTSYQNDPSYTMILVVAPTSFSHQSTKVPIHGVYKPEYRLSIAKGSRISIQVFLPIPSFSFTKIHPVAQSAWCCTKRGGT